ncbi:MAG: N-6 DNA methylase [Tenericutes bacterium]|nr:N-6 DNA methylase [Mycoplasmatota bacterium]
MNTELLYTKNSRSYEKSLDSQYKKNNGIYYTDISLAKQMIDALKLSNIEDMNIIDPTCGTGSFLYAASEYGFKNIFGLDIDKGAIKIAKNNVPNGTFKVYNSISNSSSKLMKLLKLRERFHVVIGNPPYAPITNETYGSSNDYLFQRTVKSSGDNLFVAGLLRAKEMVCEGGLVSYIIPKNFLHVNSYSLLRRELLRDYSIMSIVDIGMYFKNVRGEQIILTFKKSKPSNNMIKIYSLIDSNFMYMTMISQDFYKDTIVLFDSEEDFTIYNKFKNSYTTLNDYVSGYVGRGKKKGKGVISGKDIRKFGLKNNRKLSAGNKIFIQNIYSKEAGIIACFGGDLDASETVTVFTDGDATMCRYVLGIIHSRLINYFLHRYCFNKSSVTMHVDAKYLKKIPFIVSEQYFDIVLEYVDLLESSKYMSETWFIYLEELNRIVYKIYNIEDSERDFIDLKVKLVQSRKWVASNGKKSK